MSSGVAGEKRWLRRAGLRPRKRLGQHFLINPRVIARLLRQWELPPRAPLLEIGPGAGALTLPLLAAGHPVVAVETDARLCDLLTLRAGEECPAGDLTLIEADILTLAPDRPPLRGALRPGTLLIGNLPYGITTGILEWTIRHRAAFGWASFMVQREYAERLLAAPGSRVYGSLTVRVGFHFAVARETRVGPANFWPPPQVESLVIRLRPHAAPPVAVPSVAMLERVVRAAFAHRRRMLAGSLAAALARPRAEIDTLLAAAGVDGRRRAEQCDLGAFAAITRALAASDRPPDAR